MAARSCSTPTAAATSSSTSWAPAAAARGGSAIGRGRYATPVWSPRGDLIAFTRLGGASSRIGVMHPDGIGRAHPVGELRRRGADLLPERPGAHVLAGDRRRATTAAAAMRRGWSRSTSPASTSAWCRRPTDASDPAWSPLAGMKPAPQRRVADGRGNLTGLATVRYGAPIPFAVVGGTDCAQRLLHLSHELRCVPPQSRDATQ